MNILFPTVGRHFGSVGLHLVMLPPLLKPLYIQTFLPSNDHVRAQSVLTVEKAEDLTSNKLGVTAWEQACLTCNNFLEHCPGHSGSLELPIPVYRIFFVKRLLAILNCVCFYCQKLRLPREDPQYGKIRALPRSKRLEYLRNACHSYKVCTRHSDESVDDTPSCQLGQTDGCGQPFVQFRNEDRFNTFVRAVVVLDENDVAQYEADPGWRPVVVTPEKIFQVLQLLDEETCYMLGCDEWNRPESCMWSVITVPSLNTRPCHTFGGLGNSKKFTHSDWTKLLRNILTARNELREMLSHTSEEIAVCHYTYNNVEALDYRDAIRYGQMKETLRKTPADADQCKSRVAELKAQLYATNTQMGGLEGAWRNLMSQVSSFHHYAHKKRTQNTQFGKPLFNVEDRYRGQKTARFRGHVVARRINNAGRGVLEGDMTLRVDQVGIPQQCAMILVKKIYVNSLNIAEAYTWVLNGPYRYPGANYVMLRTGVEVNLQFFENRRDLHPEDILFVRRHLLDGDDLMVGRQPTLHRPSMMTFKCRVISGNAVKLHFAVFTPMGADCDGDEVYFQVPQNMNAVAEMRALSAVEHNVMKDGKIWIKFIQNAIVGAYLLTDPSRSLSHEQMTYVIKDLDDLWEFPRADLTLDDGAPAYSGRALVSLLLPSDFTLTLKHQDNRVVIRQGQMLQGRLNASVLNGAQGILGHLYRDYADKQVTLRFLHDGYLLFQNFLDLFGHSAGYDDCALEPAAAAQMDTKQNLQKLEKYAAKFVHHEPTSDDTAVEYSLRQHIDKLTQHSAKQVFEYHTCKDRGQRNGILHMINSGAKGSVNTLNQMCGLVGQMYVRYARYPFVSSHFLKGRDQHMSMYGLIGKSYAQGVDLVDLILEAHPTGESVQMKNKGVSNSGYSVRKIMLCMMGIIVDSYGRVVDTHGRVLWRNYGNDGYDSQKLIECPVRLLRGKLDRYLWEMPWSQYLTPSACAEWEVVRHETTLHKERDELAALRKRITTLLVRASSEVTVVRSPFSFQHLFERCRSAVGTTPLVGLTPIDYYTFSRELWARLVDDGFVLPTNLLLQSLFFDWFSVRSMVQQWHFDIPHLHWLGREIRHILRRARVEPGEAVGLHSTQNLGEPFSQMCLKSPHIAGKFTSVIAGADRIKDLVDAKYAHSQMTVVLKKDIQRETQAESIGLAMTRCYLKDVCARTDVCFQSHMCRLTFHLDRVKTLKRLFSVRTAVKRICNETFFTLPMFEVSFMDEPELYIRLNLNMTDPDCWGKLKQRTSLPGATRELIASNVQYNLMHTYVVGGNAKLENFVVEYDKKQKRWQVTTLGSDLRYVLRMPGVDTRRTTSTNIPEMCQVFGLHAARKCLEQEFLKVLSGMADSRHIKLIARRMASDLAIHGMKIQHSGRTVPPLQRASFEKTTTQMVTYCADAERDYGQTLAGGLLMNKLITVGTCYNLELKWARPQLPTRQPVQVCKYVCSPKADGTRYYWVMFCDRRKRKLAALINRSCRMFAFETQGLPDEYFNGTVLDGELTATSDGHVFLLFDCLMLCGNKTSVLRYDQRLEIVRAFVTRLGRPTDVTWNLLGAAASWALPMLYKRASQTLHQVGQIPFKWIVKPVLDVAGAEVFQTQVAESLPFQTDGLIFTHLFQAAYPFRMRKEAMLKWKLGTHNTIDVTLKAHTSAHTLATETQLARYRRRLPPSPVERVVSMFVGHVYFSDGMLASNVAYQAGATYECQWDTDRQVWLAVRLRDKAPNSWETIVATVQNLEENVQVEELVKPVG